MKILFLLGEEKYHEQIKLTGVKAENERIESERNCWEKRDLPLNAEEERRLFASSEREKQELAVVTDSIELAPKLASAGFFCVGLQEPDSTGFFPSVRYVVQSLEDLDLVYLQRQLDRFWGRNVEIARSGNLLLRESKPDDFTYFYEFEKEKSESKKEEYDKEKAERQEKYLAYIQTAYELYGFGHWTVEEIDSETVVGRCGFGLHDFSEFFGEETGTVIQPEIGYLIGSGWRRKGYAKAACLAALQYFFENTEYTVVYARINRDNIASRSLAKKLGFAETGKTAGDILLYVLNR